MPVGRCFQRAGVQDAPGVKPGNGGEVVRLHVRNPGARLQRQSRNTKRR